MPKRKESTNKPRKVILFLVVLCLLAIPLIAVAQRVQKPKPTITDNTGVVENIEKEITWKPTTVGSFPRGEYPTTKPVVKVAYVAPVYVTEGIDEGCPTDPKQFIYCKESGNTPTSINPTSGACGLGQALPCSKLPCSLDDYACQDNWFSTVYLARYNYSWVEAKAFWKVHRWW